MAVDEPGQVGEELQDGEFVPAPRSEEIDALNDDALEKAIREKANDIERERNEQTVTRLTRRLPKEPEEEASDNAEPTSEATEDNAEGTTAEAAEAKATPEDERSQEILRELELQKLRNDKLEAEVARSTYQRDHFAGEIGHLKQLLSKPRPAPEPETSYDQQERPAEVVDEDRRELRDELSSFRRERVQSVIAATASHFESNVVPAQVERFTKIWGKDAAADLDSKMKEIVKQRAPEFADELNGTNPKRAQLAVETILKSALADAQIATIEARRETVQREREAQAAKLRERKQDSDMAGRGRVAPKLTPRAKTPDELNDQELDNAIQRAIIQEVNSRGR